ncbi:MAG: AAA family ATPase [Bacteroidetes bacterium]|nr:AAA family ATPase [Bacteroidota bacterium]
MARIDHFSVSGFKSIRNVDKFELGPVTILIGDNGTGKSNLLSFFNMFAALSQERLQEFVHDEGGPDALLFGGRKHTSRIQAGLSFNNNNCEYEFSLESKDNSLIFSHEKTIPGIESDDDDADLSYLDFLIGGYRTDNEASVWPGGNKETFLAKTHESLFTSYVLPQMKSWQIFHFQNMCHTARVRNHSDICDNLWLKPDASNLSLNLFYLKEKYPNHYRRIVQVTNVFAPFFVDFVLNGENSTRDSLQLEWYHASGGQESLYSPQQLSDGLLRFICLSTLLNQPHSMQPSLILIDEPELGLNPYALALLSEMIQSAANYKQVIISTQSPELINNFDPQDIVVVSRQNDETVLDRLDLDRLDIWFENHSLGDLWKMNVIGSRPLPC